MPDHRRLRSSLHSRYINIEQKGERQQWARALNVDEAVLREAVGAVGPVVEDILAYFELKAARNAPRRPPKRATPSQ